MKRIRGAAAVVILAALACDEPVSLPPMGAIYIRFAPSSEAVAGAARHDPEELPGRLPDRLLDDQRENQAEQPDVVRAAEAPAEPAGHFTDYRIVLQGPSGGSRDTTVAASASSVTLSGLPVGTYTVIVEGRVNGEVDYYGTATGIQVTKGQTANADLSTSFRTIVPTLNSFPADTTRTTRTAVFSKVPIAAGYRLEWADNAAFTNATPATKTSANDTTHTFSVSNAATYHVRVFATVSGVSNPKASATQTFKLVADPVPDSPVSASGLRSGFGAVHDTLGGLNIVPAGDEDWFNLTACRGDELRIETLAARLTPASPLNTVLRLFRKDGTTQLAVNDNLDGSTTDSRIQVVTAVEDTFKIEVTGSGNSTGHYDLIFEVRAGDGRTGSTCTPRVDVTKSTVAVSSPTITAGQIATFTLTARDQNGNQMTTGGSTVVFSLSGGTSNGTIGTVTDNNNGTYTATFTGQTAGTASTVNATIDGAAVTTALPTITVTPGTLNKLGFTVQPSGATAGTPIQPVIEVAAQDAYGNLISSATGVVTVSIQNNPVGGTLFGSVSKPLVNGIARFDDLKIDKASDNYTLRATSGSLTAATSNAFSIVAGAAQKLAFVVQPSNITGGDPIAPSIQVAVRDGFGNTVTAAENEITLAFANNTGSGTLSGTITRKAVSGVATFNDIAVNKAANNYTLGASATLLEGATSNAFNVTVGPARRLAFTVEPGNTGAGEILAPAVKITVTDNGGNTVSTAADSVTMGFGVDPTSGAATLAGTKKVKPVSGVATFSNLSIDKSAPGYALRASGGTLAPDTSATFDVLPAVPYKLAFQVQPANTEAGATIAPSLQVVIQDAFGNTVVTAENFVTLEIGTNPPGDGLLSGTVTRQAVAGVATFNDLNINKAGTGYTLSATSSGLVGVTSSAFNVAASVVVSATQSSVVATPSTNVRVFAETTTVVVTLRDADGNPIEGRTVQLSATGAATDHTIIQPSSSTDAGGVTSGKVVSRKAELKTITATANPGLTGQVALTQEPTVLFIADARAIHPTVSTAVANPTTVPGDNVQQSTITVTVKDSLGNGVPNQSVLLASSSGTATITQPGNTNASGVTEGRIKRSGAATETITVTVDTSATGTDVVLTTQPVVDFQSEVCPFSVNSTVTSSKDTVVADGIDLATITVTLLDCTSAPVPNRTVQLAMSGSGNNVTQPASQTNSSGVATGTVKSTVAETKIVSVTVDPGLSTQRTLLAQPEVVFKAGPAAAIAFKGQPSSTPAGSAISPAVQVAVVDAQGNTVPTATNTINVRLSTNPTAATLLGDTVVDAAGGVATFVDLAIQAAQTGYVLQASATGFLSITSTPFTVTPAAPSALAFTAPVSNVAAGASITPAVAVKVVDQYNNTVTSATNAITVAIGTNAGIDSAGTLSGTKTKNAVSGVASFTNLSINRAGNGYTLTAAASGLTGATSSTFNVTPGAPFQLKFVVQPVSTTAGANIAPAVQVAVKDGFGNTVTGDVGSVALSFGTDPTGGSATLAGTVTKNAVSGIATFSDLNITKAAVGYTLVATRTGLTQGTSAAFNINAAASSKLAFTVQPANAAAGSAVSPSVQVTVQDPYGNTASGFSSNVTVAIGTNPPGDAVLSGTVSRAPVDGVATFNDLSINKVGTGYTLSATATGVTAATSASFNITAAAAAKLAFTVQPSTVVAGVAIAPAVQVTVQDGLGNTVSGATNAITVAILDNPGGSTLFGTTTVAAENGVASFSTLSLDKAAAGYTLQASSTGLTSATSNAFTVTAASPSASTSQVSANPAAPDSVLGDGVQTATITVTVRDGFGNPVSGQSVTLAASGTGNTITQPAAATNASGVTTGTLASTAAESKTVTATVGASLLLDQTASVKFYAGLVNGATSSVALSDNDVLADGLESVTITVTVRDNNSNPVPGQTVQIAVSGSGNTVTQPAGLTDGSGVATGSVVSIGAGTKTVTVTVNPGASQVILANQPQIVFRPGPPHHVSFVVQPVNVAAGAAIQPAIQAAIQDQNGNTVDTAVSNVTLSIAPGTGNANAALYGTTTQPASAGIATFTGIKLDSAAAGYQLRASSGGLIAGTSTTFTVSPGPPYTVTVSPAVDSIFSIGGTKNLTAVAKDSVGNVIPAESVTFTWSSSNELVATVNSSGTVTAAKRGLATITATAASKSGNASLAVAVRLLGVTPLSGFGSPPTQVFSSGDLPGTFTQMSVATFNATAPEVLRASYDVILIEWNTDVTLNADWTTRLLPYLQAGGGVIFEDPYNVGDLAPAVTGALDEGSGAGIILYDVPNMTDGITNSFFNRHMSFTDWSTSLAHFVIQGSDAIGLYGRFGSGCVVINGPDVAYHGNRGGAGSSGNEYNLFLNQLRFAADCPLNATPGTPVSVRVWPNSVTFTNAPETKQLRATALDEVGTPVPSALIAWSSLNPDVATVDASGLATAVANGQASFKAVGSAEDYALASVGVPAATSLNAWGTEVSPFTIASTYFLGAWGTSLNDLFLVGADGIIRHFNGSVWETMTSGSPYWLWGVWGSSGTDVYAAGEVGTILHYNGSAWNTIPSPVGTSVHFYDVWGSSPRDVFIVGTGGTILHYDGVSWQSMTSPTANRLWGVWGTASNNVYAVGDLGTILHYDGTGWTSMTSGVSITLSDVWGSGPNDIFAVGWQGPIVHFDGSTWSTQTNPASSQYLYDVWGSSSSEVFAVGCGGTIIKYNGASWSQMASPTTGCVLAAFGSSSGQLRAAGESGEVWRGVRGATASSVAVTPAGAVNTSLGTTRTFTAKLVDGSGNVITQGTLFSWASLNTSVATFTSASGVANSSGTFTTASSGQVSVSATLGAMTGYALLTSTAASATAVNAWGDEPTPTVSLIYDAWGSSPSNIFAVGLSGTIIRFTGTSWSSQSSGTSETLLGIWGTSANDAYAVGTGGAIRQWNGSTWNTFTSGTTTTLYGVWGSAPNNIYVAGLNGTIRRWNGSAWSTEAAGVTTSALYDIFGLAANDIWVVGSSGTILRYNGSTWSSYTNPVSGTSVTIFGVWGSSSSNVFAVGTGGTIIRWNGSTWSTMTSPTTADLNEVWGSASGDVYAAGNGGTVLRFNGTTWSTVNLPVTNNVWALWGTPTTNVWALGTSGEIRRGARGAAVISYGYPTDLGTSGSFTENFLLGEAITVSDTLEMTHFGIRVGAAASSVKLGLYTSVSGNPSSLVVQASGTVSTSGALEFAIPQKRLLPGTYWIMAVYNVTTSVRKNTATTNTIKYISHTFTNALPTLYPAHTTYSGGHFNYYVKGYQF